ncbi:hypothetical protein LIER_32535 [Lithospermum erythrorhizon]|uniref:Reverse transcriptase domain-containing protein n=1 Tax=Lithospermum erythrorhizon TaxID=34254 RepID=A0AAV3RXZ9_LITER
MGKFNLIIALQSEDGTWVQDERDIQQLLADLEREFSLADVKSCLASMNGSKAPRSDGFFLRKFNVTLITLVPKVERPINMAQFRPIALCNTVAKVISKMLAKRLKYVLPSVISESQSTFLPN